MDACRTFMQTLSASALTVPYLILAEEIPDQTVDVLKKNGCLACITKPFEPQTLLRRVDEALNRLSPQNRQSPDRKPENTRFETP